MFSMSKPTFPGSRNPFLSYVIYHDDGHIEIQDGRPALYKHFTNMILLPINVEDPYMNTYIFTSMHHKTSRLEI